ncbi:PTS lactose transporter subunit IIA [Vibrio sp. MACH09]|uniref:PTS lactose/cellobiose transporter subunit IIA n=1 Tax=Vibrio sp. MACH09 TaxID=3025122 RepID=UPI00279370B1|nr:PTS lactose/cellobiose transporter subunit IIA [Vibrio sp. MACH09]GLO63077.1 PTS lactose transporter subunit IIA [Vibrio sp. MACH09]
MSDINTNNDDPVLSEEYLMGLLCSAGSARSATMEAMKLARSGNINDSLILLDEADKMLNKVHSDQTYLIGLDEGEGKITMTLILTHIQDHIMTGMLCRDIANEIIELYRINKAKNDA